MNVSYRQIAKLLFKGIPLDDQDYSDKVEEYIKSIEAMPVERQATLKASYIFSRKAPFEERQDLFQHLIAHILELMATWSKSIRGGEDAWCYVVARHEWKRITRERKRHNRMLNGGFVSLNKIVPSIHQDGDGTETELQELLAGKLEWTAIRPTNLASEINSKLDCQAVLDTLPDNIKAIVDKRLNRQKLTGHDHEKLARYREANGETIREALKA